MLQTDDGPNLELKAPDLQFIFFPCDQLKAYWAACLLNCLLPFFHSPLFIRKTLIGISYYHEGYIEAKNAVGGGGLKSPLCTIKETIECSI